MRVPNFNTYAIGFAISATLAGMMVGLVVTALAHNLDSAGESAGPFPPQQTLQQTWLVVGIGLALIVAVCAALPFTLAIWFASRVRAFRARYYVWAGVGTGAGAFFLFASVLTLLDVGKGLVQSFDARVVSQFLISALGLAVLFAPISALAGFSYWLYAQNRPPISSWREELHRG